MNATKIGQTFNATALDTATVSDDVNATKIGQTFNVTITDITTTSDQTATNLQFVPIDNLEVYWKFDHITPTYESEFIDTSEWQQTGTHMNIDNSTTSGQLEIRLLNDQTGIHAISHQLSGNASDTEFVLRFPIEKMNGSEIVSSVTIFSMYGIADTDHTTSIREFISPLADSISVLLEYNVGNPATVDLETAWSDGTRANQNGLDVALNIGFRDIYVEIIRTSATSVTWNFYNDTGYTELWKTQTRTIPATVDQMDFIRFGNDETGSGGCTVECGFWRADINNIKFWNTTTDITSAFHTEDFANIPDADSSTLTGTFNKTQIGILGVAWESDPTLSSVIARTSATPSQYDFLVDSNSTINMWINDESCDNNTEQIWANIDIASADGVRVLAQSCSAGVGQANMHIQYFDSSGSDSHIGVSPVGYYDNQENQFHMYTIVHDTKAGLGNCGGVNACNVFWYKDGVLVDTDDAGNDDLSQVVTDQTPFLWNSDPVGLALNNATFDEWSFWSRQLNSTEISDLYNDGFGLMLNNFAQQQQLPVFNVTITDTVTSQDSIIITKIGQLFNVTITDTVSASDQTATKLPFVPIDNLEVYWKFDHITPTFQSEFIDSTDWNVTGTEITPTNSSTSGHLEVRQENNQDGIHGIAHDLGSPASDTSWVLRFPLENMKTTPVSGNTLFTAIGISDQDETVAITEFISPLSDSIGISINYDGFSQDITIQTIWSDNARMISNNLVFPSAPLDFGTVPRYIEIIRNSATSVTWNIYNDTGFTQLWLTDTRVIPSTVDVMNYIKFGVNEAGSPDIGDFDYDVDNVKFWNATTDIHSALHTEDFANIDDGDSTSIVNINQSAIGILGNAFKTNATGVAQQVTIGGTASDWDFLISTSNTTHNFWIKDEGCTGATAFIFDTRQPAGEGNIVSVEDCGFASKRLQTSFIGSAGSITEGSPSGSYGTNDARFDMYSIVHDNTNDEVLWYKNGTLILTSPTVATVLAGSSNHAPNIFSSGGVNFNNATGDEWSVWSRTLNASEISTLYNDGFGLMLNNFAQQQQPPVFNVTITDIATVVDSVTVTKIEPLDITDLEAYWKFEETSGNMTTENFARISDANSISDTSVTKSNTGVIGNGWRTSDTATTVKVIIGGTASDWLFVSRDDSTYNWWMQSPDPSHGSDTGYLFASNDFTSSSFSGDNMILLAGGTVNYNVFDGGTIVVQESAGFVDTSCRPTCTSFSMYTVTKNLTSTEVLWYRNGTLIATDTGASAGTTFPHFTPIQLFHRTNLDFFTTNKATFDEWSIWSRVLTPTEITALFNNGSGLELAGNIPTKVSEDTVAVTDSVTVFKELVSTEFLEGYWKFEEDPDASTSECLNSPIANIGVRGNCLQNVGLDHIETLTTTGLGYRMDSTALNSRIQVGNTTTNSEIDADWDFMAGEDFGDDAFRLTWNFWLNLTDIGSNPIPIMTTRDTTLNSNGLSITANPNGSVDILHRGGGAVKLAETSNTGYLEFDDGEFHMYTITRNNTGGAEVKYYKDGVLFDSDTDTASSCFVADCRNQHTPKIGFVQNAGAPSFREMTNSTFDEIAVWSIVLPPDDVSDLFNQGIPLDLEDQFRSDLISLDDLEVYWKFEETSGNMTTEAFVNIPDANSISDTSVTKTNTGIIGNGWRTSDSATDVKVIIGGTASDWLFVSRGNSTYNWWMQSPDPAHGSDNGYIFSSADFTSNNFSGDRMNQVGGTLFYNVFDGGTVLVSESASLVDISCRPNCTSFSMYTVTKNLTSTEVLWYRNGTLIATDTGASAGTTFPHFTPIQLFHRTNLDFFTTNKATFDEWSIWSRVLTPTEITNLFRDGNGLPLESQIPIPITNFTVSIQDIAVVVDQVQNNGTGVQLFNATAQDTATVLDLGTQIDLTKLQTDIITVTDTDETTFNPVPNAINNLVAFAVGDTCELTWSSPLNLGDPFAPINGYKILKSVAGGSFNVLISNTSSTLTAFNDTGLLQNADHDYDVRALNKHGEALGSNIDTCVPQPSSPPNSPTILIATAVGTNVQLDWIASTEGSPSGYFIERKIAGGGYIDLVLDTGTTSTTFLDNTVIPATQFFYRVSAINAFGISAPSNEASVTTLETPDKPTLFAVQNGSKIDLSWTLPTSDSPINGFRVEKRINLGLFFDLVSNTTNTNLTLSDDNLTAGNVYGFRVRGLSEIGTGAVSNVVDVNFGSHVIVQVREQDGTSYKGGGSVIMANTTFSTSQVIDVLSNANFDNFEVGNYNFTFIDLDDFILNRTINFPFPSGNLSNTFEIRALVFDVDCPSNGGGTDVRIKVNYTNLHDITQFPSAPVCDSSDKISWSTTWAGSEFNSTSTMIADFISVNFMENAEQFLVSTVPTGTSYDSVANRITSDMYGVVPQIPQTSQTINFDLFLDMSPPQGGSGGGGGGTAPFIPSITPRAEDLELTGLSLLSRTHQFAQAGDIIRGFIDIQWEGEDPLTITRITIGDFRGSMVFLDTPRFDIPQSIEGSGEFAMSSGSVPYVITLPPQVCQPEIGLDQNCLIQELFSIPVEFEFEFKGQTVTGSTNIVVDASPVPFDIVQLQVILLGVLLIASALAGNFIRQRIKKQRKPATKKRRKFKKKFDSS